LLILLLLLLCLLHHHHHHRLSLTQKVAHPLKEYNTYPLVTRSLKVKLVQVKEMQETSSFLLEKIPSKTIKEFYLVTEQVKDLLAFSPFQLFFFGSLRMSRRDEDRTYGHHGQLAGTERAEPRNRRRDRDFTAQELREFERLQPRKQVITDFDAPMGAAAGDDGPAATAAHGRGHPDAPVPRGRRDDSPEAAEARPRPQRARPAAATAAQAVEDPYLMVGKDDAEDAEVALRRRERRPRDLRERVFFAQDRMAELTKRRRLLGRCLELEEAIRFTTEDGVTVPAEDYFAKVDEAYELAKSFE